jgi:glycogen operon protein
MLSHGDELGRTQGGNNNAYAQDNEITWVNWELEEWQRELLDFTRKVFAVRHANPVLRRRHFFEGSRTCENGMKEVTWLSPEGHELTDEDWHRGDSHALGMLINGAATDETDDRGRPVRVDTLLLVLNNGEKGLDFALPCLEEAGGWWVLVDTSHDEWRPAEGGKVGIAPQSVVLLRHGTDRRLDLDMMVDAVALHRSAGLQPAARGDRPVPPQRERRL